MSRPLYRFGDCTIDASARELCTGGKLVTLSPKVFDCLIYLLEHRDRAVGRDELISAVWGKLDVTDTLLGQTILKARRAVGDSGDGQNVIRTIPRFGYRWVAEIVAADVVVEDSVSTNANSATDTSSAQVDEPSGDGGTRSVSRFDAIVSTLATESRRIAVAVVLILATAALAQIWFA